MDIAMCNCEWPDPHPPHIYAELLDFGRAGFKTKVFACTGTDEEE